MYLSGTPSQGNASLLPSLSSGLLPTYSTDVPALKILQTGFRRNKKMASALIEISNQLAAAAERAGSSVVNVGGRSHGSSSGIHWRRDVVVTANHTVKRDEDIAVTLSDGRSLKATLVGRDGGTDLAVLKVEGLGESPAQFSEASASRVGNLALVLGRHRENGLMASLGAVSLVADSRRTWAGGTLDRYIRLDVALYPGSSGGSVVDVEGRIIGMATAALSRVAPLTVPVSTVNRVSATLLEKGHIPRGYLGIGLQPVSIPADLKSKLSLTNTNGIIVLSVEPGGPAERGGLMIGDILIALEGQALEQTDDLQTLLNADAVGKSRKVQVIRGGKLIELSVQISERPRRS
jgi:S1-C subfamily serine protease